MELRISCPFCDVDMVRVEKQCVPGIRVFRCGVCSSEFRQQLVVPASDQAKPKEVIEQEKTGCSLCFESDVHCQNCGDGVCEDHVQSWRNYSEHLPRQMLFDIDQDNFDKTFCPICFPLIIERKTLKVQRRERPKSPFRNPWTILLMAAVIFFSYMAKKCG